MKRGDVYLTRFDPTESSEQGGIRPAIIVSRNAINASSPVVVVVPCTTFRQEKRLYPSHVFLRAPEGGLRADSVALGEQVRVVAKQRLIEHWGSLPRPSLQKIEQALLITLDLPGR